MADLERFDESDEMFMASLSQSMADLIPQIFPGEMDMAGQIHTLHILPVSQMDTPQIEQFLGVVDKCLGPFYARHKGPSWKIDKLDEMAEPGLIYIWYEHHGSVSCFLSLMMVLEPLGKTLYLYEIHVSPEYQGRRLGSRLMGFFHDYGNFLNQKAHQSPSGQTRHLASVATGLTVFSDNEKAKNWYFKLGYDFSADSPLDKRLRNGKVVKPSFYILYRLLA
ncbi:hypothetical protein JCM33374_g353 [Metschnikowia sp. JCM 33374]|nr:hypothetical protein JCM33374_g353 [Metschnikowia sp. JCM 33374]